MIVRSRAAIFVVATLAGLGGCSAILGIEADRHVVLPPVDAGAESSAPEEDSATADVFAPPPPGWECINDPQPPPPSVDQTFEIVFNDVTSASSGNAGRPIVGASVQACNKLDIKCTAPFSEATTNDAGIASLTAPGGFTGFWEVRATDYTPAILARTTLIGPELGQQSMANLDLLTAGASLAGITQDPSLAVAIVDALDCNASVAADIVFEVGKPSSGEQVIYLDHNLPSQAAMRTDSESGSALVFNVPPGTLQISAYFAADHRLVRSISALARVGWVTFVQVRVDQAHRVPLP